MTNNPSSAGARPGFGLLLRRFLVVGVLIVLDLWSKAHVFEMLRAEGADLLIDGCGHKRMHVLGENVQWFTFMYSENPGAAFGMFADYPHALIGLRVVAVIALAVMIIRARLGSPWFNGALMLVLAGALGNLYDNLMLGGTDDHPFGKVRDFIDVYFAYWDWHFPTFNVADSCISVGAVILLIGSFAKAEDEPESESDSTGDSDESSSSPASQPE